MSKITKEELETLSESQKKYAAIKHDLGQLEVQKHGLLHMWAAIQEEDNKFKKELEDKYGKININLEDGSYEEIKEEQEKVNIMKNEVSENTKLTLDLRTIGIVIAGAVSLALMYTDLNAGIEEAKLLPEPSISRTEYDLKDQLIRETIENTAKQVEENSNKLDKIDEKLYEIIQK